MGPRAGLDGPRRSRPPPPGFDLPTLKPIGSRYTNSAIPSPVSVHILPLNAMK